MRCRGLYLILLDLCVILINKQQQLQQEVELATEAS